MNSKTAWLIVAKTSLHVGNENTSNYGLIDKAVQRDAVTGLPCINSSSLKGAINEYASQCMKKTLTDIQRKAIFGVDKLDKNSETSKGNTAFFDADILALPRPNDTSLYELVSSDAVLSRYCERLTTFGMNLTVAQLKEKIKSLLEVSQIVTTLPNGDTQTSGCTPDFRICPNDEFADYCSDYELPIIARNHLDNWKSTNLWYEQILPRETVFGTLILAADETLTNALNEGIVQIGANATVGYGYCKFIQIAKSEEHAQ